MVIESKADRSSWMSSVAAQSSAGRHGDWAGVLADAITPKPCPSSPWAPVAASEMASEAASVVASTAVEGVAAAAVVVAVSAVALTVLEEETATASGRPRVPRWAQVSTDAMVTAASLGLATTVALASMTGPSDLAALAADDSATVTQAVGLVATLSQLVAERVGIVTETEIETATATAIVIATMEGIGTGTATGTVAAATAVTSTGRRGTTTAGSEHTKGAATTTLGKCHATERPEGITNRRQLLPDMLPVVCHSIFVNLLQG